MNIFIATIKNGTIALPPGTEFSEGDEVQVRLLSHDDPNRELPDEFHQADPASIARWQVYYDSIPPIEDPERFADEVGRAIAESRGKTAPIRDRVSETAER